MKRKLNKICNKTEMGKIEIFNSQIKLINQQIIKTQA